MYKMDIKIGIYIHNHITNNGKKTINQRICSIIDLFLYVK